MQSLQGQYESNDQADIKEEMVFLNSELKYIAGGECCLTRNEL